MASLIHATGHGLVAGDTIRFGSIVPTDTGIDETQTYYVISAGLTADDFEFSEEAEGTPFTLAKNITEGVLRYADKYEPTEVDPKRNNLIVNSGFEITPIATTQSANWTADHAWNTATSTVNLATGGASLAMTDPAY